METLFLAHRIPFPPDRGDKIRSWNMLKHLAALGPVHLACFADDEADAMHLNALRDALRGSLGEAHVEVRHAGPFGAAVRALRSGKPVSLPMFDSAAMRSFVDRLLNRQSVDTIFAFSSQMAQFVPDRPLQRFVMDFVDMDSAKFAQYAEEGSGPKAWVYRREAEKLFAFERATAARADSSLFVSEAEAALFRDQARLPGADIRAIGNGIDLTFYDPAASFAPLSADERGQGLLIVFTGQMDYRPNVEAVTAFAEQAMPILARTHPAARFFIVGRNPTDAVRRLGTLRNVHVTGAVADVRSWLAAADVVVTPLRIARGIQNKVLEAMAMARPVVASHAAHQGIDAIPGRDLLVADEPSLQAEAIAALIDDPVRAAAIGAAARLQMQSTYRWEATLAPLTRLLAQPARRAAA